MPQECFSDNATLERSLGWRWLLGDSIYGPMVFRGHETESIRRTFAAFAQHEGQAKGQVCVVADADTCSDEDLEDLRGFAARGDKVAIFGNAATVKRIKDAISPKNRSRQQYGLLPSQSPRVVIPLGRGSWIREGLALHQPGRRLARIAVRFGMALSYFRLAHLLFRQRLMIIEKRGCANGRWSDSPFALYLGTADAKRKTIALPLGQRGSAREIIKIAHSQSARQSLQREANVLASLKDSPVRDRVPEVFQVSCGTHELAVHLEYRPRRSVPARTIESAVEGFLVELGGIGSAKLPLTRWLETLPVTRVPRDAEPLLCRLRQIGVRGEFIHLQRIHGDFAPWNCFWTNAGLFVFDWEESRARGVALADAFSYIILPKLLIGKRSNTDKTVSLAIEFGKRVAARVPLPRCSPELQLASWVLQGCFQEKNPLLTPLVPRVLERLG